MTIHPFFKSKTFLIAGTVVLVGLVVLDAQQYKQHRAIALEIGQLQKQADQLQQQNSQLQNLVDNWQADPAGNTEKIARTQLNMQKPGEQVFSFAAQPDDAVGATAAADSSAAASASNPRKWWNYFFAAN